MLLTHKNLIDAKKFKATKLLVGTGFKDIRPLMAELLKKFMAKVVDPNEEPISDALIEIYDNSDLDFDKRKRFAACRVGVNGGFRFKGLSPGKYELRGSYCRGFDAGHTIVTLEPKRKDASKAKILVTLNISQ
ncbi:MAG TPA: carboxypeptidase-like regulatory domain-containing protein [Pyrinomonadaceae bacterium]|jgi:hypothetical protein